MSLEPETVDSDQLIGFSYLTLNDAGLPEPALDEMNRILAQTPDGPDRAKKLHTLAIFYRDEYMKSGNMEHLEAALQNSQEAVMQTPDEHQDLPQHLQTLGDFFTYRFQRSGNVLDLDNALKNFREAVAKTAEGDPQVLPHLSSLAAFSMARYLLAADLQDLETAIQNYQALVKQIAEGHSDLPMHLQNLAGCYIAQYQRLGELKSLDLALESQQKAVDLIPEGNQDYLSYMSLAVSFTYRFQRLKDLVDLEASLLNFQKAALFIPQGNPHLPLCLHNLASAFRNRYLILGQLEDLDAALQNDQAAVAQTPNGHSDFHMRLQDLGLACRDRYQRLGDLKDLEAALEYFRKAVENTPDGMAFTDRFQQLGELKDLEAALKSKQNAVAQTAKDHPQLPRHLQSLGVSYRDNYMRLGDLKDLDAMMQNFQEAVDLTPAGHPHLAGYLESLAVSQRDKYERSGDSQDLQSATKNLQAAVAQTQEGHPDYVMRLQNLAACLTDQYQASGNLKYLKDALEGYQRAVAKTPEGHPDLPKLLQNLAGSYMDKYRRSGNLQDLEKALAADKKALAQNTGWTSKFTCTLQDLGDLEAAVEHFQKAVAVTPEDHPALSHLQQSLGRALSDRYLRLNNLEDLQAALSMKQAVVSQPNGSQSARPGYLQTAVFETPEGHSELPARLRSWAASLTDQYQHSGDLKDLEAALEINKRAVEKTAEQHPDYPGLLQSLAFSFILRFQKLKDPKDLGAFFSNSRISFETASSNPVASWEAALKWAAIAQDQKHWDECLKAYSNAFRLLSELLWIGNPVTARQEANRHINIAQTVSDAVSACIEQADYVLAIELLEQGLATTFQQVLELKTSVDMLQKSDADEFQLLSSQLYSGTSEDPKETASRRHELLEEIRKRPGFEYFLSPKPYKELCRASQHGPVVILNSHAAHCDAIIILNATSDPIHVALANVNLNNLKHHRNMLREVIHGRSTVERAEEVTRLYGSREGYVDAFQTLLSWIWMNIVKHVYGALKLHNIAKGRLWWCPMGAFIGLPLHAADISDQFIQSYTSTLGALLNANSKKPASTHPILGVVGVTHTAPGGKQTLPGVQVEITKILSTVGEEQVQSLVGEEATVESVQTQLKNCSWIHLACHGEQNMLDPPRSRLLLYKGSLELDTILQMSLENAELVFLAACQTAKGDAELVNESFHLGGGFIAAGFRGAIGTMWSMLDKDGPVVAETVYSHFFRNGGSPQATDAAEALQLAVRRLRDEGASYERWVPFIHIGV
ncbi:CHAT domain-containing protein [Mycena vulgaris]|nr:CHAT domain-containing protein [Mycena vulgaris]